MKTIIGIVNFNSDASCLPAEKWLDILKGGRHSQFYKWIELYCKHKKKMVLGLMGSTVADIAMVNPESIDLINHHPDIFEMTLRPYIHDIGLLRSTQGFNRNFQVGQHIIRTEFNHVLPFFLPPEFMLTSEQIGMLSRNAVHGTFINSDRFSDDIKQMIPTRPYKVKGVLDSSLYCIPCDGKLTRSYLNSLYQFDGSHWNKELMNHNEEVIFFWRDGESSFFIPDGIKREAAWLEEEHKEIHRAFISELDIDKLQISVPNQNHLLSSYPVHSFSAWMKEFRMLGFVQKILELEKKIDGFSLTELGIWLQAINSDILSSVEKASPRIRLHSKKKDDPPVEYVIKRSERGFEGEDYLALLNQVINHKDDQYLKQSKSCHIQKLRSRIQYLERILD